jgi:hypothetical protein
VQEINTLALNELVQQDGTSKQSKSPAATSDASTSKGKVANSKQTAESKGVEQILI